MDQLADTAIPKKVISASVIFSANVGLAISGQCYYGCNDKTESR